MDSNPSQPSTSTLVVVELYKEDQQATGGPTSLGVTSEEGAYPKLSSDMSTSIYTKPIYSASTIIHPESASEHDVLAKSKAEADSGLFAPKDSISQTIEKTKSASEWLETVLTKPTTMKGVSTIKKEIKEEFNTSHDLSSSEDTQKEIKLEDLTKLVQDVQPKEPKETEDASASHPPSPKTIQIQKLTNQLTKLLVKSLQPELLKILSTHDFSGSLPTELKELPSKFTELTGEVKDLKKHVKSIQAKVKTLDALPSLLNRVTKSLNKFTQVIESALTKAGDKGVSLAGPADTKPAEGEKNTQQATISQLFQRRAAKDAEKANLNNQQPIPITTLKNNGKKAMSSKDAEEEGSESDSDDTIHLTGFMVESSKKKKLKKYDFVTEGGDHVHLTEEQIKEQKRIGESDKAEGAKHEVEVRRKELVDLLVPDVVSKKGPITLKVHRRGDTYEVILNFKASDFHLVEWNETRIDYLHQTEAGLGIDLNKPLSEQDLLDKMNELAKKKRKHADDIHDYFRANKRLKSPVQYEDHPARTVLNEPVLEIFFRLHQGPGIDDHARTFSSFLLAEVDKRNLNPFKQMRGEIVGSVVEPFSVSLDLNIKSPKNNQAEDSSACVAEKLWLQFFGYLEDQDYLHFSLCGGTNTEERP
ncbi:hypothetical protein Tco_1300807 [Tanacetum coccineum]